MFERLKRPYVLFIKLLTTMNPSSAFILIATFDFL